MIKRYDWHTDGMWCIETGKWVDWMDYERQRFEIERLRKALHRIAYEATADGYPVDAVKAARDALDGHSAEPGVVAESVARQVWTALDDLYALVSKQDMEPAFRGRIERALSVARWAPRGAEPASRELTPSEAASFGKAFARSPRVIPVHVDVTGKTREPPHCPSCSCGTPADLVGALQDVVHTDPGPVRAAYASREASKVLTENCPKCGKQMSNWSGNLTKCQKCLHEWYMDTTAVKSGGVG